MFIKKLLGPSPLLDEIEKIQNIRGGQTDICFPPEEAWCTHQRTLKYQSISTENTNSRILDCH